MGINCDLNNLLIPTNVEMTSASQKREKDNFTHAQDFRLLFLLETMTDNWKEKEKRKKYFNFVIFSVISFVKGNPIWLRVEIYLLFTQDKVTLKCARHVYRRERENETNLKYLLKMFRQR